MQEGSSFEVNGEAYTIVRQLNKGGEAHVYEAKTSSGEPRAIRIVQKPITEQMKLRAFEVSQVLQQIECPHLCKIFQTTIVGGQLVYVLELLSNAKPELKCDEDKYRAVFHVGIAITAMHAKKLMHRDIKMDNVLWRSDGSAVLSDFGFTRFQGELLNTCLGTHQFIAPEVWDDKNKQNKAAYDERIDSWSFGVMIFHLCTNRYPFDFAGCKSNADYKSAIETKTPPFDFITNPKLRGMCRSMLTVDPAQRPRVREWLVEEMAAELDYFGLFDCVAQK